MRLIPGSGSVLYIEYIDGCVICNAAFRDEAKYTIGHNRPHYPVPATIGECLIGSTFVMIELPDKPNRCVMWQRDRYDPNYTE